jgi:hypothetical protein
MEDFKSLVKKAHEVRIKCNLDGFPPYGLGSRLVTEHLTITEPTARPPYLERDLA